VKKDIITLPGLPQSPLFSHAVKVGSTVYLSGIAGLDPATGQMAGITIQQQTRQSLENCEAILQAAGASRDDIVDVQVLLANPVDFAGMNEAYWAFFPEHPPARSVCKLGAEVPNLLVSIRMTAVL
jgi:2-iminobutanoate/2-iminopropanoate deaminase